MNYRDLCTKLKAMGFFFFKEGGRHEIWSNASGSFKVAVPRKKILNMLTAKRIIKDAERGQI
jgi:predicted RNA binding protein YcfA (HicA-like mRNA interferase family)